MSSKSFICRLCGSAKEEEDIVCELNDLVDEASSGISLLNYISYYCRLELNADPKLPQKVCRNCRLQVEIFIAYCNNLSKVEERTCATFKIIPFESPQLSAANLEVKIEQPKEEPADSLFDSTRLLFYRKRFKDRTSMQNVKELYAEHLTKSVFELEAFSHITVDRDQVSEDGVIAKEWLEQYEVVTWKDFKFTCHFCKLEFTSLMTFLLHLREEKKVKIDCHLCQNKRSQRSYSSLNAYINHVVRNHEMEHLSYTCIDCCKTFYNISCLIKHIDKEHPNSAIIYPCIECGTYCQGLSALKVHQMTHKSQEISDEDGEENGAKVEPKQRRKRSKEEEGEGSPKKRKTFPCDHCERTLLTRRGWDYHKLIHSDSKPYACNQCDAAYRSKQDLDKHKIKHLINKQKKSGK